MKKLIRSNLSTKQCQCAACGEVFVAEYLFNLHRVVEYNNTPPAYGRRCLTTDEMKAKNWVLGKNEVWHRASDQEWVRLRVPVGP